MEIQDVQIWKNGTEKVANQLDLRIIADDLSTAATFYYSLSSGAIEEGASSEVLTDGNLTISGEDYQTWGDSGDINLEAYVWAAGKLSLTLV